MTPENKPKGEIITSKQGRHFATEQGSGSDTVVKFYEGPCDQDVGEAYVPCKPESKGMKVTLKTFLELTESIKQKSKENSSKGKPLLVIHPDDLMLLKTLMKPLEQATRQWGVIQDEFNGVELMQSLDAPRVKPSEWRKFGAPLG